MSRSYKPIATAESECCLKATEKPVCSCSYDNLLVVIGKKWAVVILNLLYEYGPLGYNAMLNKMSDITPKAFGDKLKLLEEKGLIARRAAEKPRRVFYQLTSEGKTVLESLHPFFDTSSKFRLGDKGGDVP